MRAIGPPSCMSDGGPTHIPDACGTVPTGVLGVHLYTERDREH
jgi:hypothetical protein